MKNYVYAGFWRRTLAVLINMVIAMIFHAVFLNFDTYISIAGQRPILVDVLNIALMFFSCIVSVLMLRFLGADIGGLILKMRVVNAETGNHQSVKNLIIRFFMQYFNFLSFVSIFYDSRKQGWHDKVSSSLVVVKSGNEQEYRIEFPTFSTDKDRKFNFLIYIFTILFALVNTAFLTISLHEDSLLPEAAAWIGEHMEKEENPEDNGFYYLIGFGMTTDVNQFEKGYQIVQEINKKSLETREKVRNRLMGKGPNPFSVFPKRQKEETFFLEEDELVKHLCKVKYDTTMLDSTRKYKKDLSRILNKFESLDSQITRITDQKTFINTEWPNWEYTTHKSLILLSNYLELKIMLRLSEFDKDNTSLFETLDIVDETGRYILKNSSNEYHCLVSGIIVRYKSLVLELLLDSYRNSSAIINQILEMENLTDDHVNLQNIAKRIFLEKVSSAFLPVNGKNEIFLRDEFFMRQNEVSTFYCRFFKPNKYINSEYKYYSLLCNLHLKNGEEIENFNADSILIKKSDFNLLNNPVSVAYHENKRTLNVTVLNILKKEMNRINLLKLKAMIYRDHVKEENIQEFLNAHADSLYDVLTREPMKWNYDEQEIYFGEKTETPEEYEAYLKMERDEKKNRRFRTSRHENPDALKLYFN